eukprot:gb/GFBE01027078.1/.p1 GENE.gb/GFBE01027078.1/~~gb/GFBE01027078.1/.p1  ORF type:complete len:157 (+),score=22.84 gb/GFBE01027078.1/:1-471(+)
MMSDVTAMHVFHWIESLFLSFSVAAAATGILQGSYLYSGLTLWMPDGESQMAFMADKRSELVCNMTYSFHSLHFLLMALPFLAARTSAVAFFCAFIPYCMVTYEIVVPWKREFSKQPAMMQQLLACELLRHSAAAKRKKRSKSATDGPQDNHDHDQ